MSAASIVSRSWRPPLAAVGLSTAGLVALAEIDRLVAAASFAGGATYSVAEVVGPRTWSRRSAWDAWAQVVRAHDDITGDATGIARLIGLHTAADVVFVCGYTLTLCLVILAIARGITGQGRRILTRT